MPLWAVLEQRASFVIYVEGLESKLQTEEKTLSLTVILTAGLTVLIMPLAGHLLRLWASWYLGFLFCK